jgi:NADPH2:quinone reductase
VQQILDLTQGRGVDLILAMKSGYTLAKDMQMVADYGRIVLVGGKEVSDGKQVGIEIEPDTLLFKNADILGLYIRHLHNIIRSLKPLTAGQFK